MSMHCAAFAMVLQSGLISFYDASIGIVNQLHEQTCSETSVSEQR